VDKMSNPFIIKYDWNDFDNTWGLTDFQKYRIKNRYQKEAKDAIQEMINESVKDKNHRRDELNAHTDPDDPFMLDLGGEG